jgi:tetratricopeptide (TPR) repeat protein
MMRRLLPLAAAAFVLLAAACAPKAVPLPIVTTPKFPEFTQPPVPPALAKDPAAVGHERAWRFFQAGDLRNAEREIAAALKLSPAFYPTEATAGLLELGRKDPKAALARFDRAIELQGSYAPALIGRGETLVALNREPEAIAAFGAALAIDPSRTELQRRIEVLRFRGLERNLAAARAAAKGDRSDEARRAYQSAIASSPDSAFLYRELGTVERRAGDTESALANFRKAVELESGDAFSIVQIGELLEARGDQESALTAYNDALRLEPNEAVEARRDALVARAELAKLPEEYRAIGAAGEITRADLAALIGVRLSDLVQTMRREALVVTDIRSHWATPWIMAVARAGIIEPFPNHTFQPGTPVRRADLAQAASRVLASLGSPAQVAAWQSSRPSFTDMGTGHLAYTAAAVAVAAGVLQPAADGTFQPARTVSGAEAIATMERLEAMADRSRRAGSGR